jgi:hypothetical protein
MTGHFSGERPPRLVTACNLKSSLPCVPSFTRHRSQTCVYAGLLGTSVWASCPGVCLVGCHWLGSTLQWPRCGRLQQVAQQGFLGIPYKSMVACVVLVYVMCFPAGSSIQAHVCAGRVKAPGAGARNWPGSVAAATSGMGPGPQQQQESSGGGGGGGSGPAHCLSSAVALDWCHSALRCQAIETRIACMCSAVPYVGHTALLLPLKGFEGGFAKTVACCNSFCVGRDQRWHTVSSTGLGVPPQAVPPQCC